MDWLTPCAGMEPLPTTALEVSGKKNTNMTSKTPEKMTRNQKMDRQPRESAKTPPIVGPKAGPTRIPAVAYPMYFPLSADVAMSATTAIDRAMAALHPAAWTQRSTSKAAKFVCRASPMFAKM